MFPSVKREDFPVHKATVRIKCTQLVSKMPDPQLHPILHLRLVLSNSSVGGLSPRSLTENLRALLHLKSFHFYDGAWGPHIFSCFLEKSVAHQTLSAVTLVNEWKAGPTSPEKIKWNCFVKWKVLCKCDESLLASIYWTLTRNIKQWERKPGEKEDTTTTPI